MVTEKEKKILNSIKYAPMLFTLTLAIILSLFLYFEKKTLFETEKEEIKREFTLNNKQIIKDEVNRVYTYINNQQKQTMLQLKNRIKTTVDTAYDIIQNIYLHNKNKSKSEIIELINNALRTIRFSEGRGYFFIYGMDGTNLLHPMKPHLENKSLLKYQDSRGTYLLQEMQKILSTKSQTFYSWYWDKPTDNTDKELEKIGFFKKFAPLGIFIGTGEYIEDFEAEIQRKILSYTSQIRYGKSGYIFIISFDGKYLSHLRKEYIGKDVIKMADTKKIQKVIFSIIDTAKKGDGYIAYIQNEKLGKGGVANKTSYVKGLQKWEWVIGTGFYEDDLNLLIDKKKKHLDQKFQSDLQNILITFGILTLMLLIFSFYISKRFINRSSSSA